MNVLIDCCHSGTVLDLPYIMNADDGTISAIEAGSTRSVLGVNVDLNISKVITDNVEQNGIWDNCGNNVG